MTAKQRKCSGPGLRGRGAEPGRTHRASTQWWPAASEGQQEGGLSLRPCFSSAALRRWQRGLSRGLWEVSGEGTAGRPARLPTACPARLRAPGPHRPLRCGPLPAACSFDRHQATYFMMPQLRSSLSSDTREVVSRACQRLCVTRAPCLYENKPHSPQWPPSLPFTPSCAL